MLTDTKNKQPLDIPEENIIDVNIDGIKKQKYRINGGGIIELDTSDLNIITRLKEVYPKLNALASEATSGVDVDSSQPVEEQLDTMADVLKEIDEKMREYVDYIFDSEVCDVCAPNSSMYAPHGGKFTYEHITESLGKLYSNNLDIEAKRLSRRLKEHTDKYTGKRK